MGGHVRKISVFIPGLGRTPKPHQSDLNPYCNPRPSLPALGLPHLKPFRMLPASSGLFPGLERAFSQDPPPLLPFFGQSNAYVLLLFPNPNRGLRHPLSCFSLCKLA